MIRQAPEDTDGAAQTPPSHDVTIFHPLDESAQVQGTLTFTSMGWVRLKPMTRGFVEAHRSGSSSCKKDPGNALRARVVATATRRAQESGIVFSTEDLVRTTPRGTVFHPTLLYDLLTPKTPENKFGIAPFRAKATPDPNADAIALIPTWCDFARKQLRSPPAPLPPGESLQHQLARDPDATPDRSPSPRSPSPRPWSVRRQERALDDQEREFLEAHADAQTGAYDIISVASALGLQFDQLLRNDCAVSTAINSANLDAQARGEKHRLCSTTFAVAEVVTKCARLEENEAEHVPNTTSGGSADAVNFEENATLVPTLSQSSDGDDLAEVARALSDTQTQLAALMRTISALQVRLQV